MKTNRLLQPALMAAAALAFASTAGAAMAQQDYADTPSRRLDRIEKQLREVREIVLQARATGAPVEIKEAGPDPQIGALTARLDDMDQTLRGLTGQIETLQHDLDVARRNAESAQSTLGALSDRVDKLERAAAAAPGPQPGGRPSAGGPSDAGGTLGDQTAAPAGPAGPADPKAAYEAARQLLLDGDYKAASAAFQDYVDRFGDTANARSARYWLGETKYIQEDYASAAQAYLSAIRGWPATSWAPDAVVKLALSLNQLGRTKEACGALAELPKRYPKASATIKTKADAARQKAGCVH
jgi:tol-pal system protein YbgF